jgi:hypothetical protein
MKFFAVLALVGATAAHHHYPVNFVALSSSSSSSASDEEDLALEDFGPEAGAGPTDVGGYERVIPARFAAHTEQFGQVDIFIRSMLEKYAMEGAKDKEEDPAMGPNGVFYLTKAIAKAAARETLATNKALTGPALDAYLATYFDKAWGHFDVNQTGAISVYRAAEFMRFLASDQYMSLG